MLDAYLKNIRYLVVNSDLFNLSHCFKAQVYIIYPNIKKNILKKIHDFLLTKDVFFKNNFV